MLQQFRSQQITWDKANKDVYEKIYANAGDTNGRKLVVQVLNNNVVEDITGAVLSLAWNSKTNGTQGLDAFTEIDASEGLFEIYYTTGMLTNLGKLKASLVLVDVNGRIESKPFEIVVSRSSVDDEAIQSENSFTALTEALVKVSQIQAEIDDIKEDIVNQGDNLISEQTERFDDLHDAKESELDNLHDTKLAELNQLRDTKETELDNLYNDKESELDTLHGTKKESLESLEEDFSNRAEHLEETYAPRLTGVESEIDEIDSIIEGIQSDLDSLFTDGEIYKLPLTNGWTGDLYYSKNDLGQVTVYGSIDSGEISAGAVIATLPEGFRPRQIVPLVTYSSSLGISQIGLFVSLNGDIAIRHPAASASDLQGLRINTIYYER